MTQDYKREAVLEYAAKLHKEGFTVYVSDKPHYCYGIFTDAAHDRVVYFQHSMGEGITLATCIKPSRNNGSGWRLPNGISANNALAAHQPSFVQGLVQHLTLEQYLKNNTHSDYKLFNNVEAA